MADKNTLWQTEHDDLYNRVVVSRDDGLPRVVHLAEFLTYWRKTSNPDILVTALAEMPKAFADCFAETLPMFFPDDDPHRVKELAWVVGREKSLAYHQMVVDSPEVLTLRSPLINRVTRLINLTTVVLAARDCHDKEVGFEWIKDFIYGSEEVHSETALLIGWANGCKYYPDGMPTLS
ncbi:MAG: hypothetical protein AAFR02_08325 [Pseudomonadota bacterium]